ncbi:MAG: penicillin-binding transpeptidase domain-containing protein [Actinomycetota bacterium]|nr:penicillin-binding transpeptidase domain-containing protein [Actinomycetota bacterium]
MLDSRVIRVGVLLLICFALLLMQLTNIQVRQAAALDRNPLNQVVQPSPFFGPRGEIISSDGYVLAESKRTNDQYHYLRVYPPLTAAMFSGITGYYATAVEANPFGIEASYNQYLAQHESPVNSLHGLFTQHLETDDVILTVSERLQAAAMHALDSQPDAQSGGAVVAIDPRNGNILAMYSNPSYNPNLFAVHNPAAVNALATKYNSLPNAENPLYNDAIAALHPPGSTFKIVTTSAIYDHHPSIANQSFPVEALYDFPHTGSPPKTIHNYAYEVCGGSLAAALAVSCDTSYSQIAYELGASSLASEARAFGFGSVPPIDVPGAVASQFPPPSAIDAPSASPYLAYSAIGQYDDNATALQMALATAAVADHGKIMAPHLVSKVVGSLGNDEFVYRPHVWRRATSAKTAASVLGLMTGVTTTNIGTAYTVFQGYYSSGFPTAAAKTGTAQPGGNGCGTYNWLVAAAPAGAGQTPSVVVAAMVPVLSSRACTINPTGASVAGPVAVAVLEAALRQQGGG